MCEFKVSCVFIADRTVVRRVVGVCVIGNKHKKKLRRVGKKTERGGGRVVQKKGWEK